MEPVWTLWGKESKENSSVVQIVAPSFSWLSRGFTELTLSYYQLLLLLMMN
jgi:hypothetical protein